jgi:hypothetical protein
MNKIDPLAQLKDIHLPDPISWWPLAPGWYLLFFLIIFLVSSIIYLTYTRYCHALAKKQALVLLARYHQAYKKERNGSLTSAHISELLRRVALVYFPREDVAGLKGDAWLQFLNRTGKGIDFNSVSDLLLYAPFKKDTPLNLDPLFNIAKLWIKQRRIPCSN